MKRYAATIAIGLLGTLVLLGCNGGNDGSRRVFDWTRQGDDHPDTGERWAILLYVSRVTNHYQDVREAKKDTAAQTGWDEDKLIVLHEATHSKLLRGPYVSPSAASKDLEETRGFTFKEGGRPFGTAIVTKLPATDYKEMFPQWKLSKTSGEYTVCVAVFYNYTTAKETFNRRRWTAEMYCKHLRDRGQEAYYHHGKSRSTVTIGAFPDASIKTVQVGKQFINKVVDPRIHRIRQSHPTLIVNGWTEIITVPNRQTKQVERRTAQSYVVRIPDKEGEIDGRNRGGDGQPGQAPRNPAGTGRPERISPWP